MPVADGDIVEVTLGGIYDGQLVENVLHMRERGVSTDVEMNTSINALLELWKPLQQSSFQYNQPTWKRTTPVALDQQFTPITGSLIGTGPGAPVNSMLACVITLRTGVAGKTHRGRIYMGALAGDLVGFDRLNAGGVTAFNTFATNLLARFNDATGTDLHLALGIYSRVIGGSHPQTLAGWQAVTQVVPHSILGSQRRRRVGVGA